ncbi:MAG: penicillin-binding transpeptidase domain-containing protein [Candidatus Kapaibacterium sp.]
MNDTADNRISRKKFWKFLIVTSLLILGIFAVMARLFSIQVLNFDEYREKARRQHQSRIVLSAERGSITDRDGSLLASTVRKMSIAVDPTELKDKKKISEAFAKILGGESANYLNRINSAKGAFLWIERGLSPEITEKLGKIKDKGLIIIEEPGRNYLYGRSGAQLIGCTDIDNKGLSGIELGWDSVLSGRSGYMVMYRDGLGRLRPSAELPMIPAINGYSLQLTIDMKLQEIIEHELKLGVLKSGAASGTVAAIKPSTGEILAMASYPGYDPNFPGTHSTGSMRNRAVTDVYEPGSTFKLITAAAAMEEGIVSETDVFDGHKGERDFGKFKIRDEHPLKKATFREAVIYSSNIIFSEVANNIKANKFYKYIRDFGFGLTLDIDVPGEIPGKIKKPGHFNNAEKRFMGFGYGMTVTPLQIVNAYAAVANGGVMMKPHIVKAVYDDEFKAVKTFHPDRIRRIITQETASRLRNIFTAVVDSGTGQYARVPGLKIAGKTGTSQQVVRGAYSKSDYTASFAGYFPADNPEIAMIVVLDKPRGSYYGGSTAAPIFRDIALRWINSGANTLNAEAFPQFEKPDSIFVPTFTGMEKDEAIGLLNSLDIEHNIEGREGIVIAQYPDAGKLISVNDRISLQVMAEEIDSAAFIKPDVKGMTLRNALALLHKAGVSVRVKGSGKVYAQYWRKESKGLITILECRIY